MDSAFADELRERLSFDSGWKIRQEVNLQGLSKVWCKYDIGCYYDNKLIGLFELSVSDTNVAHALHNGEVKLLGICDGISVHEEEQSLKTYKKLGDNDINYAQKILSNIPVRGLVFIAGKNPPVETEAKWYLTEKINKKDKKVYFYSALFDVGARVSLETVLAVLQKKGLYTWYL